MTILGGPGRSSKCKIYYKYDFMNPYFQVLQILIKNLCIKKFFTIYYMYINLDKSLCLYFVYTVF